MSRKIIPQGFTLIELILAFSFFLLVSLSSLTLWQSALSLYKQARNLAVGSYLAAGKIENILALSFAEIVAEDTYSNPTSSWAEDLKNSCLEENRGIALVTELDESLKKVEVKIFWLDKFLKGQEKPTSPFFDPMKEKAKVSLTTLVAENQ